MKIRLLKKWGRGAVYQMYSTDEIIELNSTNCFITESSKARAAILKEFPEMRECVAERIHKKSLVEKGKILPTNIPFRLAAHSSDGEQWGIHLVDTATGSMLVSQEYIDFREAINTSFSRKDPDIEIIRD